MKKKKSPVINIGISSILSIFIILAMLTFAMLTFMTSRKDAAKVEEQIQASNEYLEAVALAHEKIAEVTDGWTSTAPENETYSFTLPCGTYTELNVELKYKEPTTDEAKSYEITAFYKSVTDEWKGNKSLNVFEPDSFMIQ